MGHRTANQISLDSCSFAFQSGHKGFSFLSCQLSHTFKKMIFAFSPGFLVVSSEKCLKNTQSTLLPETHHHRAFELLLSHCHLQEGSTLAFISYVNIGGAELSRWQWLHCGGIPLIFCYYSASARLEPASIFSYACGAAAAQTQHSPTVADSTHFFCHKSPQLPIFFAPQKCVFMLRFLLLITTGEEQITKTTDMRDW